MNDHLRTLLAHARARWNALTDAEREAMLREQRESWVRGERAMGNDADEAEWRRKNAPG